MVLVKCGADRASALKDRTTVRSNPGRSSRKLQKLVVKPVFLPYSWPEMHRVRAVGKLVLPSCGVKSARVNALQNKLTTEEQNEV